MMDTATPGSCAICHQAIDPEAKSTLFAEAGEWLAEEIWKDGGTLCPQCLENRARLVMMYAHDCNT